jgi:hypothetical protein
MDKDIALAIMFFLLTSVESQFMQLSDSGSWQDKDLCQVHTSPREYNTEYCSIILILSHYGYHSHFLTMSNHRLVIMTEWLNMIAKF